MIEVRLYKAKVTKSILKQMKVSFDERSLRDAPRVVGWFYGEATLGREYSRNPYVLCEGTGGPFLFRCEFYQFDGTFLLKYGMRIPQIFIG